MPVTLHAHSEALLYLHAHSRTCSHAHPQTRAGKNARAHACIHAHAHSRTCTHAHTLTHISTLLDTAFSLLTHLFICLPRAPRGPIALYRATEDFDPQLTGAGYLAFRAGDVINVTVKQVGDVISPPPSPLSFFLAFFSYL